MNVEGKYIYRMQGRLHMQPPKERGETVICPECGADMKLRDSAYGLFYGCSRFPECKATHGAHPDGKPLGIPGDKETRVLRSYLHILLCGFWDYSRVAERSKMYSWLEENASKGHISMLQKDELKSLIKRIERDGVC